MIVQSSGYKLILCDAAIAIVNGNNIRLYKNNYTPVPGSVLGDFTAADFDGYADAVLGTFNPSTYNAGTDQAEATNTDVVWTAGALIVTQNIYGYVIFDGGGLVIMAERFDTAPLVMDTIGQTLTVRPIFHYGDILP